MGQGEESAERNRVQSIERAIDLLRSIASADSQARATTATSLASACAMNRATAWRILKTLEAQGMVIFQPATERYSIGPTAVEIGRAGGHGELIALAHPTLERLNATSGETASLAAMSGGSLTYLSEVLAPTVLAASWAGRVVPIHATSTGKVLLAWAPEFRRQYLEGPLQVFTNSTITDPADLTADLSLTRERGFATCRGEYESTLFGVSAPIFNQPGQLMAVLSLWGPAESFNSAERFAELGALVHAAADEVSARRQALIGTTGHPAGR